MTWFRSYITFTIYIKKQCKCEANEKRNITSHMTIFITLRQGCLGGWGRCLSLCPFQRRIPNGWGTELQRACPHYACSTGTLWRTKWPNKISIWKLKATLRQTLTFTQTHHMAIWNVRVTHSKTIYGAFTVCQELGYEMDM